MMRGSMLNKAGRGGKWFLIGGLTFVISLIVMLLDKYGLSMDALRSVYNYYALFVIPCAVIVSLNVLEGLPERLFKNMIILWFLVSTIQFFIYRGFATQLSVGAKATEALWDWRLNRHFWELPAFIFCISSENLRKNGCFMRFWS